MALLKMGSKGEEVKKLQERLNELGYDCGKPDGIFGIKTQTAVQKLQKEYNLVVDGIVGYQTNIILEGPTEITHFTDKEFRCRHCGKLPAGGIDKRLLIMLEQLRKQIGNRPIIINSGYRCPEHNKASGGAKNSQHLYGRAADIRVNGMSPRELEKYCDKLFVNDGVGMGGQNIVHVDTRGHKARWYY